MLSWETGGNPADGVWARYWYENVHRSTGFGPYRPKAEAVSGGIGGGVGGVFGVL